MRRLIDRNRAVGGWVIFYTHDVTDTPSPMAAPRGNSKPSSTMPPSIPQC